MSVEKAVGQNEQLLSVCLESFHLHVRVFEHCQQGLRSGESCYPELNLNSVEPTQKPVKNQKNYNLFGYHIKYIHTFPPYRLIWTLTTLVYVHAAHSNKTLDIFCVKWM